MYENKVEDILKAQSGNKEIMTKLVTENSNLIWSIVTRFKDRGYEIEDLYQIGCIGFIKSIKRFDTNYEVKLSTYAVPYILGEIKRFIRDDGPVKVSRSIKELSYKIKLIQNEYITKKGRDIQIEELAKLLKVSKEDIVIAMDSNNTVESIDKKVNDSDDLTIMDKLKSNVDQEKDIVNKITIKTLIEGLDEKSKKIIMLRYYRGKTQSQVAELLGVTQVQVSRLEKKILSSMKHKLCSTG
ncbi:MAG TPA: SigB/SigF/SigG family RNA polymerase sigma factor [Clostridiaceae bacterium]|jgi:RNA polymerase sporulation-specific sigma factor|nr:SigB/SigF/SigG family RNA polymerase sigma factor [Clostridiaceae bacterium]